MNGVSSQRGATVAMAEAMTHCGGRLTSQSRVRGWGKAVGDVLLNSTSRVMYRYPRLKHALWLCHASCLGVWMKTRSARGLTIRTRAVVDSIGGKTRPLGFCWANCRLGFHLYRHEQ
jgi:hypothetical protein